ncbi:MAG: 1-acyl-sn-glycerol-3-phosphate acyltransferase [Candidatus Marinimicrobia bacterium]|nr:1-acyl-sn-glycerol-3-phosphate acyltransferase [Candidatus Neomarinimicrobiota bacterium]
MRIIRSLWVLLNIIIGTVLMGVLAVVIGLLDRKKHAVGLVSKAWAKWILWSTGLPITVTGLENLVPGQRYIHICNHSSALDIPFALAYLPRPVVFMAKQELFKIPLFGWAIWAAGCIPVNRSNRKAARKSVERAIAMLREKPLSMVFFPEGTRTRSGELLPFKKGVFFLALKSRLPLAPMAVSGAFEAVPPEKLYLTNTPIDITIGMPLDTGNLGDDERDSFIEHTREIIAGLLAGQSPPPPTG